MTLQKALNVKVGNTVFCPEDRGQPAYAGTVKHITADVQKNFKGVEFIWVTVADSRYRSRHVWPSNRLG